MANKDFSDYFAAAYGTGGFSEGMKLGFLKWQQEQENKIKQDTLNQTAQLEMATKLGMSPIDNPAIANYRKVVSGGQTQLNPQYGLGTMNMGNQSYIQNPQLLNALQGLKGSFISVVDPTTGLEKKVSTKQATNDRLKENNINTSWDRFLTKNNPEMASSRSTLGQVSIANLRANRALEIMKNPTLTYQDLQAEVSDFAGIMMQGTPTDRGMKDSEYKTMRSSMANIQQYLTGNPQDAIPAPIKQHITENLQKLRSIDNAYLKNHLEGTRKTHGSYFKKVAPDRWQGYEDIITGLMGNYADKGGSAPQGRIGVVSPDGVVGHIPSSQLDAAIKAGYKKQ